MWSFKRKGLCVVAGEAFDCFATPVLLAGGGGELDPVGGMGLECLSKVDVVRAAGCRHRARSYLRLSLPPWS